MIKRTCPYCNISFEFEKYQQFGAHKTNCKYNPKLNEIKRKTKLSKSINRIEKEIECKKCNNLYHINVTKKAFERGNYRKFCSRKCANSRQWDDEHKRKLSKSLTSFKRNKISNKLTKNKFTKIKYINCPICNEIKILKYNNGQKTCGKKDCRYKLISISVTGKTGGMRNRGGNGKVGHYKGILCQSSWELAYVIYNIEHNIEFKRNTKAFPYIFKNKRYKYYPDFIQEGYYIEIKGFKSDRTKAKINQFPHIIKVLYWEEMKSYLEYTINKYGEDFIKLYDEIKTIKKNCKNCGKDFETFLNSNKSICSSKNCKSIKIINCKSCSTEIKVNIRATANNCLCKECR